jgi:hypothetical protein
MTMKQVMDMCSDSRQSLIMCSVIMEMHFRITATELFGIATAQAVSSRLPTRRPGVEPRSGHLGFVVDKVALGQVFSEYFGFPCQFSFHRLLHNHHLSSGAGTIGQTVNVVLGRLSLTQWGKKPNFLRQWGVNGKTIRRRGQVNITNWHV